MTKHKTLLLIICIALLGCGPELKTGTILSKSYDISGRPHLKGICIYEYRLGWNNISFTDSCGKYSIGDRINLFK